MKYVTGLLIVCIYSLTACTQSVKKNIQEADETREELNEEYREEIETPPHASALDDVMVNPKIVRPDIVDNKASIDVYKEEDQTIDVEFISFGYKEVHVLLSSHDTQANIRISQFVDPAGQSDGPFGRELRRDLTGDGLYKIMVDANQMAGEPWSGYFTVDVELIR